VLIEMYSNGYQGWFMSANTTNYMFQAGRGAAKSKRKFEFFTQFCCMAHKRKSRLAAAARARQARHFQETSNSNDPEAEITDMSSNSLGNDKRRGMSLDRWCQPHIVV
jgi:hypothetical protein